MPSRKSDQAPRKSSGDDVSAARFALIDEPPTQDPAPATTTEPHVERPRTATEDDQQHGEKGGKPAAAAAAAAADKDLKDATTIEDLTLPKSIITRLAKGVLPANTQIQANAILALSKSTTVFINFLASHANEHAASANRKTIAPPDVFKALEDTEFGGFKERLEAEFAKFHSIQSEKRSNYRQKTKAAKHPSGTGADAGDTSFADTIMAETTMADNSTIAAVDDDSAPRAKKARIDPTTAKDEVVDDAETEDEEEDHHHDEEEDEAEEDDEDEDEGPNESGDETQDALEEREFVEERDEALEGDESD